MERAHCGASPRHFRFLRTPVEPSQKSAVRFRVVRMNTSFCRRISRIQTPRVDPTIAFAPPSQALNQGFFLPQGLRMIVEGCRISLESGIGQAKNFPSLHRLHVRLSAAISFEVAIPWVVASAKPGTGSDPLCIATCSVRQQRASRHTC